MEAASAVTAILPKLASMLTDEYKLHSGVKDKVSNLKEKLTSMQVALEAVPPREPSAGHGNTEQLNLWARKVRELAYDADDTIDSYLVRISTKPSGFSSTSRPWCAVLHAARRYKARRRIAAEIEHILNEVKEASEWLSILWIPDTGPRSPPAPPADPRLHLHYENAARFVGLSRSTEELIQKLSLEGDGGEDVWSQRLKVVAVVGAGGIGKTTLAKEVYEKVREKFDCGAFVPVSQKPNMKLVLGGILRQVSQASGGNHESWGDHEEIIKRIRDVLEDKRYLIVIDDVWHASEWACINCALVQNTRGSKVITTTRDFGIAKLCRSPNCVDAIIHKVQPLSTIDAQNLFYNKVFDEDRCEDQVCPRDQVDGRFLVMSD